MTTVADTMRGQYLKTAYIVSSAKNKPRKASNVPIARDPAVAADHEATETAPLSRRDVTLAISTPWLPSQLVAVSSHPVNAPSGRRPSRTAFAAATRRDTNSRPKPTAIATTITPDKTVVVSA